MAECADIAVIGGGMAGASAAAELAVGASVILLEREAQCGIHATGRSAASFSEAYGGAVIRQLARAGRAFLESPPLGFAEMPLLRMRGMLTIGRADQADSIARELERGLPLAPTLRAVTPDEALAMVPCLRPDYVAAAFLEPDQREIDVDALHQGYLRRARALGAHILTRADVTAISRTARGWRMETLAGSVEVATLVNAAGAWADQVAALAGLAPLGLVPLRRTAFLVAAPEGADAWPLVNDVDEEFYFKPDAGRLFVSPGDETPSASVDAWPEDIDVATGAARLEAATSLTVRRVLRAWAGLRTFAPDRTPVVGAEGAFFWLAGQGGYGIKTAPALSRATAGLILHGRIPEDLVAAGIDPALLSPARLRA